MMRLFLCEARERKRSIVCLCKHFTTRCFRTKNSIRTILLKIAYDEIIFVRSKGAEAEHSKPM